MWIEKIYERHRFTSFQMITIGFLAVILIGTFLLMLPISSCNPESVSFIDALFTVTSAVCVTGLVVVDTATSWTMFGQLILLLLIQIGGIGVVTVIVSFALFSGRKIGLIQRSVMQNSISAPQLGGIVRLTGFILKGTFLIEFLGAILLFPVFFKDFGVLKGLWYSVFHSVSAFCNAGFDLMGVMEKYSSLTRYAVNPLVNFTICVLIILGGLGFLVWKDIVTYRWKLKKYPLQSKIVLSFTVGLILLPAIYFYFIEFKGFGFQQRFLLSIFQSVTPRTAGFNTADFGQMSETGKLITIILMLIGGSPGSTAGGMKTITVAVLLLGMISTMQRKDCSTLFSRRIEDSIVHQAATILMMYLVLFLLGSMFISTYEQVDMMTAMFETASALGTVGLTVGLTPRLHFISKLILIIYMYLGRVGALTLIYAATKDRIHSISKLPTEKLMIG